MTYSNNVQNSMPAIKIKVMRKPSNPNRLTAYTGKPITIGKYIPQITNGCVLVSTSKYWFLNSCACPLLWIFSNFITCYLSDKSTKKIGSQKNGDSQEIKCSKTFKSIDNQCTTFFPVTKKNFSPWTFCLKKRVLVLGKRWK